MELGASQLLTIITATKNCEKDIGRLINSLNNQTSKNFTWLVVDGGSTDKTLSVINDECKVPYRIVNSKDFSIYHATNIGIENVQTDYYAVSGGDDFFDANFVKTICHAIKKENPDLIFGSVIIKDKVVPPGNCTGWLNGMHGIGSSHSIGSVIKTHLHIKHGLYSKLYPIVADQFFIKKCVYSGAKVLTMKNIFGTYSVEGFSSSNELHYQLDFFKMQIDTEKSFLLQYILFNLRLFKLRFKSFFK